MSRAALLKNPAHLIALGFGSGLSPVAPGTSGTLWAWATFLILQSWFNTAALGWLCLAALLLGWWACTTSVELLDEPDPGMIVWDEIVAFWLVLWIWLPASFWGQLLAFVLFRIFDASKWGPVGWADRLCHEQRGWLAGWGILFDDLVAAFCTLVVLSLAVAGGWLQ